MQSLHEPVSFNNCLLPAVISSRVLSQLQLLLNSSQDNRLGWILPGCMCLRCSSSCMTFGSCLWPCSPKHLLHLPRGTMTVHSDLLQRRYESAVFMRKRCTGCEMHPCVKHGKWLWVFQHLRQSSVLSVGSRHHYGVAVAILVTLLGVAKGVAGRSLHGSRKRCGSGAFGAPGRRAKGFAVVPLVILIAFWSRVYSSKPCCTALPRLLVCS